MLVLTCWTRWERAELLEVLVSGGEFDFQKPELECLFSQYLRVEIKHAPSSAV